RIALQPGREPGHPVALQLADILLLLIGVGLDRSGIVDRAQREADDPWERALAFLVGVDAVACAELREHDERAGREHLVFPRAGTARHLERQRTVSAGGADRALQRVHRPGEKLLV